MIGVVVFVFVVVIVLMFVCVFSGLMFYDCVFVVNLLGIKIILFFGVIGFFIGCLDFFDILIFYVLINFVVMIVILKFFRYWLF